MTNNCCSIYHQFVMIVINVLSAKSNISHIVWYIITSIVLHFISHFLTFLLTYCNIPHYAVMYCTVQPVCCTWFLWCTFLAGRNYIGCSIQVREIALCELCTFTPDVSKDEMVPWLLYFSTIITCFVNYDYRMPYILSMIILFHFSYNCLLLLFCLSFTSH